MALVERDSEYPDGLAPAERRVLDYVRTGTLDAEIAVRLGVPIGDVKDRIERMLAKSGLKTKAELAAWVGDAPGADPTDSEAVIGEYVIGLYPETPPSPNRRRRWSVAVGTVAAVLAVGAGAWFTWGRELDRTAPQLYDSGARLENTEVVTLTLASAFTTVSAAGVEVIAGVEVGALRYEDPTSFPAQTAMIVAMGCWQCDGPVSSLVRLWSADDGSVRRTVLFEPPTRSDGSIDFISSYAVSPGGNSLAVALCTKEGCPWHDGTEPGGELTIFRSDDGGATWQEVGSQPGGSYIAAVKPRGVLMATRYRGDDGKRSSRYRYLPGGPDVSPPVPGDVVAIDAGAAGLAWAVFPYGPLLLPGGGVADWFTGLRQVVSLIPGLHGGYHIAWQMGGNSAQISYVGFIGDQGELQNAVRLPVANSAAWFGGMIDNFHIVGNAPVPGAAGEYVWSPVIFSPRGRTITPLTGPFDEGGRNIILAVKLGPFAEVDTPGDCLNLRGGPEPGAPVITCLADKTLVSFAGGSLTSSRALERVNVTAPDGTEGWVTAQYLVR